MAHRVLTIQSQRLQAYAQLERYRIPHSVLLSRSFMQYKIDANATNHNINIQSTTSLFAELSLQAKFILELSLTHIQDLSSISADISPDTDLTPNGRAEELCRLRVLVDQLTRIQLLEKEKLALTSRMQVCDLESVFGEADYVNDLQEMKGRLSVIAEALDEACEEIRGDASG